MLCLYTGTDPSTFSTYEKRVDDALDATFLACCTNDALSATWLNTTDCTFLKAFDVNKAVVCANINEFKPTVLNTLMDDLIDPLSVISLILAAPQVSLCVGSFPPPLALTFVLFSLCSLFSFAFLLCA